MVSHVIEVIPLEKVMTDKGKTGVVHGACGNTFPQLVEKFGTTIGGENGRGCTNCMQKLLCTIFDWRKEYQIAITLSNKEEDHF